MADEDDSASEEAFNKALEIAERHLAAARAEAADVAPYISIAMLEVAANEAVDDTSEDDVAAMLRDLADQIENGGDDDADD